MEMLLKNNNSIERNLLLIKLSIQKLKIDLSLVKKIVITNKVINFVMVEK
jgi:hypothetical protein